MTRFLFVLALAALAGCTTAKPDRFAVQPTTASTKITSNARTISVAKVDLPAYAKEPGIFVQSDTGALMPVENADWADDTERAMTLALVRNLDAITGARVAPDPWPLGGVPEAEIRVEVERMLVDNNSMMRLSGQFSIRRDIATSRNRIVRFDITTRAASRRPDDVVQAHGAAWRELAEDMARAL